MELKNYIKIYDDVLRHSELSSLLKWINTQTFEKATIGADSQLNENIRKTEMLCLSKRFNSVTAMHWSNYLQVKFKQGILKYKSELSPFHDLGLGKFNDVTVLKYQETGFYNYHVDHFYDIPRLFSCILLLNNDYEGGNLEFAHPLTNKPYVSIDVQPNRLIIWPSLFMFPHGVRPVSKGTRYSVVAWAF